MESNFVPNVVQVRYLESNLVQVRYGIKLVPNLVQVRYGIKSNAGES